MRSNRKTLRRVALTILVVIIAVVGTKIYSFYASIHAHRQRVEAARNAFHGYSKDQWKQLFGQVKAMVAKNPGATFIPQNQWPPTIAMLCPYHVIRSAGEVTMHWTGGFDDDNLSLTVDLGAGVFLHDSTRDDELVDLCVWALPVAP